MAKQTINLGTAANNGNDGDDARTAFSKVNDNFTEVYALAGGAQPVNAKLTALASAVWAANQLQYQTGAGTVANTPLTVAARALLDDPDSPAMRVTLGLGGQILQALQALTMTANGVPYMASTTTMAVQASTAFGRGLWGLANEAAGRAALGALGVGSYGLGTSNGPTTTIAALDTLVENMFISASDGGAWGAGSAGSYPMGFNITRSPSVKAQFAIAYGAKAAGGGAYYRNTSGSGVWAPWARLLEVGDYGIGARQSPDTTDAELSATSADTGLLNGMSRIIVGGAAGGSYKGLPSQDTYAILTNRSSSGVYTHQIASGQATNRLYFRRASSVDFEPLVKFGDFGLGAPATLETTATTWQGGKFTGWAAAAPDSPFGTNSVGLDMGYAADRRMQIAISTGNAFFFRYANDPSGQQNWSQVLSTYNASALPLTTPLAPNSDAARGLGGASARWSVVYSATGAINTSDAREKTPVDSLSENETEAAKLLSKEIGVYRWLKMVEEKGDGARKHIGLTVQRAIQIMESCGLDPFSYGFICYDEWEDEFEHSDAVTEPVMTEEVWNNDPEGLAYLVSPSVQALDEHGEPMYRVITEATDVQVKWGGNRYSFRYDELNLFIAAGIEARLSELEKRM